MVLWQVDSKWGFSTEILIKLDNGKIAWQVDILKLIRQEILKRTRQALPEKYKIVKEASKGDGSWWQDGFAIDSVLDSKGGPMTFPLLYHVFLSSNPNEISDQTKVDSRMTAEVNQDGTVKVDDFHLGTNPPSRNWE